MTLLLLGLLLFLGTHSLSMLAPHWRRHWIARHGEKPWKGLYSLLSLAGLILLAVGYGWARQSPMVLWSPPLWTRHLALLLMLPVFPLLLAAYLPGRIRSAVKHPMLAAVKLWALVHLLANGTLADVLLFGGFLAWAVANRISVKRHPRPPVPAAAPRPANDLVAILGGLALYALFLAGAHAWLIGVSPLG